MPKALRALGRVFLAPLVAVLLTKGAAGEDEFLSRRLDEVVRRRFTLRIGNAEDADAAGMLPEVQFGNLRLTETVMLHRDSMFSATYVKVPEDYVGKEGLRSRRLQEVLPELVNASKTPVDLTAPRPRIRFIAGLNAAANLHPQGGDPDLADFWPRARTVYGDGQNFFVPSDAEALVEGAEADDEQTESDPGDEGEEEIVVEAGSPSVSTVTRKPFVVNEEQQAENIKKENEALEQARETLRETFGEELKDTFSGVRHENCTLPEGQMCYGDMGFALSVYEDERNKYIVFHSGFVQETHEYLLWAHKMWILELLQERILDMWSRNTGEDFTAEMLMRGGGLGIKKQDIDFRISLMEDEKLFRCPFYKSSPQPMNDIENAAREARMKEDVLAEKGQWALIKKLVRIVLPTSRESVEKATTLTGAGVGGMHAALTHMWLRTEDNREYLTYVFAGIGWQCLARRVGSGEMVPWEEHPMIHSYAHIMDVYAQGIDRAAGTVCSYGIRNFTGENSPEQYCRKFVGHTGPELFADMPTAPESAETSTKDYLKTVEIAREDWFACHYYTHSIWYLLTLFTQDDVLHIDGTTDAGCTNILPVPRDDSTGMCPLSSRARDICVVMLDTSQPLPVVLMTQVASTILFLIFCVGCLLHIGVKSVQDTSWQWMGEDGTTKKRTEPGPFGKCLRKMCGCCYFAAGGHDQSRAAEARLRAQEKRSKKLIRQQKLERFGVDKSKKRKKTQGDGAEGTGKRDVVQAVAVDPVELGKPSFQQAPVEKEEAVYEEETNLLSNDEEAKMPGLPPATDEEKAAA